MTMLAQVHGDIISPPLEKKNVKLESLFSRCEESYFSKTDTCEIPNAMSDEDEWLFILPTRPLDLYILETDPTVAGALLGSLLSLEKAEEEEEIEICFYTTCFYTTCRSISSTSSSTQNSQSTDHSSSSQIVWESIFLNGSVQRKQNYDLSLQQFKHKSHSTLILSDMDPSLRQFLVRTMQSDLDGSSRKQGYEKCKKMFQMSISKCHNYWLRSPQEGSESDKTGVRTATPSRDDNDISTNGEQPISFELNRRRLQQSLSELYFSFAEKVPAMSQDCRATKSASTSDESNVRDKIPGSDGKYKKVKTGRRNKATSSKSKDKTIVKIPEADVETEKFRSSRKKRIKGSQGKKPRSTPRVSSTKEVGTAADPPSEKQQREALASCSTSNEEGKRKRLLPKVKAHKSTRETTIVQKKLRSADRTWVRRTPSEPFEKISDSNNSHFGRRPEEEDIPASDVAIPAVLKSSAVSRHETINLIEEEPQPPLTKSDPKGLRKLFLRSFSHKNDDKKEGSAGCVKSSNSDPNGKRGMIGGLRRMFQKTVSLRTLPSKKKLLDYDEMIDLPTRESMSEDLDIDLESLAQDNAYQGPTTSHASYPCAQIKIDQSHCY
jgi:hypothetical protein